MNRKVNKNEDENQTWEEGGTHNSSLGAIVLTYTLLLTFALVPPLRDPERLILVREPLLLPPQIRRVAAVVRVEPSPVQFEYAVAYVLEERAVVRDGEEGHFFAFFHEVR